MSVDMVNHPPHYDSHKSGVEAIDICEHLGFNLGNAFKYLFRCKSKHESPLEDLKKALWYVNREMGNIQNLTGGGFVAVNTNINAKFDRTFFSHEFEWEPLTTLTMRVLEHETGNVAVAMAFIVRGSEKQDDVDLQIAAACIREMINALS